MASDRQRPSSWILSLSTSAHKRAMAPPARRLRASMSFVEKPRVASPRTRTAARRAFVMCAGRTRSHWVV